MAFLENLGRNFYNIKTPMIKQMKANTKIWDYIKLRSFCTWKGMMTRRQRLPMQLVIFTDYPSQKGLLLKNM